MKANETDKYKKSCIKMIMEFPKISKLLTQKNYIVPKTPNKVCSGYWNDEYIDTIAREVGLDNYLRMYDNNVNIYVPNEYYDYWGSNMIKILFKPNEKGYICWYDEQERKYNTEEFGDTLDLLGCINRIENCEY
jgi:hypothetical protein